MSLDWSKIEKETGGERSFKDYAPLGQHEVRLDKVEVKDRDSWKSPAVEFQWQEDDNYKYPKSAAHWLSMAKPAWRQRHFRDILVEFSIPKDKANQLIEVAENNQNREEIVKAYQHLFNQVEQRHPKVNVLVREQLDRQGKKVLSPKGTPYGETDFANSNLQLGRNPQSAASPLEDLGGEEINLDGIPF